MKLFHLPLFTLCVILAAHPGVERPHVGKIIDAQGNLRTIRGIAGNFVAGPAEAQGINAMDCSGETCVTSPAEDVIATDGRHIISYSAETKTFTGRAIGRSLAEPLWWSPLQEGDQLLSMRLTPSGADLAIRRNNAVWIVSQDGVVTGALPSDADGPVLLLEGGVFYEQGDTLALRRSDGSESRFPAPGIRALCRMSTDWVEAIGGDTIYAIRVTPGREAIFVLPGALE